MCYIPDDMTFILKKNLVCTYVRYILWSTVTRKEGRQCVKSNLRGRGDSVQKKSKSSKTLPGNSKKKKFIGRKNYQI